VCEEGNEGGVVSGALAVGKQAAPKSRLGKLLRWRAQTSPCATLTLAQTDKHSITGKHDADRYIVFGEQKINMSRR
jgi:hypothetical protein